MATHKVSVEIDLYNIGLQNCVVTRWMQCRYSGWLPIISVFCIPNTVVIDILSGFLQTLESMGFGKNNVLPGNHFRKDWQRRVKTWFNQPGRKLRRRNARKAKAATLGVRPLTLLRPAVRGQTIRYNAKIREGRGFSLGELKEAGVSRRTALGLGIVVDHRRRNLSVEGKSINVERLKSYKERLVVFPRKAGKPKKGDSSVSCFLISCVPSSLKQNKPS